MAFPFLGTRTSTDQPVIDTPSPAFTSGAGFSAALTAIVAAVIAILPSLTALDVSEPVKVALIALIGAGVLAWAISASGDSLARAYGLAHVTRTEPEKPNQPAIQTAAFRLADAYAVAHGAKINTPASAPQSTASAATTPVYSPPPPAASTTTFLEFSPALKVKVGPKDGEVIAVQIKSEGGKETQQYLAGTPGGAYGWVVEDVITVLPAAPSAAPSAASPTRGSAPPPAPPGETTRPS